MALNKIDDSVFAYKLHSQARGMLVQCGTLIQKFLISGSVCATKTRAAGGDTVPPQQGD